MMTSSNIITLALELRTMDWMLIFFYNAIATSSIQHGIDISEPLPLSHLTTILQKHSYFTHPILAMPYFREDLCLEDQTQIINR